MKLRKTGVWLIGALGSISAAVMVGALCLRNQFCLPTGIVTAGAPFKELDLVPIEALEFGGCDIRQGSLLEAARHLQRESGCIDSGVLDAMKDDLEGFEVNIYPGTLTNCGSAIDGLASDTADCGTVIREAISKVMDQINHFKASAGVDEVVVVNLASTEPPLSLRECHFHLDEFERCLDRNDSELVKAGTIYAYAAIKAGCPYINFTPSTSALFPAIIQLAEREKVPVMGNDGKTGETLVKSALAPMFACRDLHVMSWEGFNILGNMDGRVLDNPENKESKIKTKDGIVSKILGYPLHSQVHINYVPSLEDQKTAWDFIHFRGFLGSKMSLQFVWQGYDSLLAAPLVLDLIRLAESAKRRGECGTLPYLASYFKSPIGVEEHRLYEQFRMLMDHVEKTKTSTAMDVEK